MNNNLIPKKKGEEGYNPVYKNDFIWENLFVKTSILSLKLPTWTNVCKPIPPDVKNLKPV